MKYIKCLLLTLYLYNAGHTQTLTVVDQDYQKAVNIASRENKLLFIDFYTTWCVPCKKLDKLIFQNDSVGKVLSKDFILLRYNAENDSIFHLTKKHHVFIFPSAVILNKDGYVVKRNYGFAGDEFTSLSKSVFEFTNQSIERNVQNKFLKGYSNKIDISNYPNFYIDYVNRTNIKIDSVTIKNYFKGNHDMFSEEYFSTLLYFGSKNIPESIVDSVLKNKKKYIDLFGETDVEGLLFIFTRDKFDRAIAEKNQQKFDEAIIFIVETLDERYASTIQSFKKEFLVAQNKWAEVFKMNDDLKNKGVFSDEAINYFCWEVYKKCDDMKVIQKCIQWMKELTNRNPEYFYLDTYTFLLYKSGNKTETKKIAKFAIEAAKKENASTKDLEKLLEKL